MAKWIRLAIPVMLVAPVFGAPMTQDERNRALSEFHASRKMFLDAISGLTPAQWNFKPDATSWSVAECSEHIALSEDALFGNLTGEILTKPVTPGQKSDLSDEVLLAGTLDRSRKFQAPEMLQPKHQFASPEQLVEHFKASRERALDYVRTTQDDLRGHVFPSRAGGNLDAYQFLITISAHCRRHVAQIEQIKANPNFPKP